MTRIAVILGSVRPNRVGGAVADWVVDRARAVEGVRAELVDLAAFNLPVFVEESAPRAAAPKDPAGIALNEALGAYDAFVFVTPEYNGSIPGALKNAIDFLVPQVLEGKRVGLVGYSFHNGERPVEHLRQILAGLTDGVVAPQVNVALAKDIADGAMVPTAEHEEAVSAMLQAILA